MGRFMDDGGLRVLLEAIKARLIADAPNDGAWYARAYRTWRRIQAPPWASGRTWRGVTVEAASWNGVAYGNGVFAAVASSGNNRVMTSPDGVNWTPGGAASDISWNSVVFGNGVFVAVASNGAGNRVMTSTDGKTWKLQASANDSLSWNSVTFGNGLFVAVSSGGVNNVMTSPDGENWTLRASALARNWRAVCYGGGRFVITGQQTQAEVQTSPDGINWTLHTGVGLTDNAWRAAAYGNGLYIAVGDSTTGYNCMTSPDGENWTLRTIRNPNMSIAGNFYAVTFANGVFVALAGTGGARAAVSQNGTDWEMLPGISSAWRGIAYGNGVFAAVANSGNNDRVMTAA